MTGWCPKHDRVFEADDGLCPKCGVALVVTEEKTGEGVSVVELGFPTVTEAANDSQAPTSRRGKPGVAVGVIVAVVAAFLAGLAFPQLGRREPVRPQTLEARSDITVGVASSDVGLEIRLESFTQRGSRIVARFRMNNQFSVGSLRFASVEVSGLNGVLGADQIAARPTVSGFILEGPLVGRGESLVTRIRLTGLDFAFRGGGDFPLDLTRVWPATQRNEPRARPAEGQIEPGDGLTVRVTGLVGWQNQLEVGLRIEGTEAGFRTYGYSYSLDLGSLGVLPGTVAEPSPGRVTVLFPFGDVPASVRNATLRVTVEDVVIEGDWSWNLVASS